MSYFRKNSESYFIFLCVCFLNHPLMPLIERTFPLYRVDAFTGAGVYGGNPAAIVVLPGPAFLPPATMQRLALENGLSETAFTVPLGGGAYRLRWMTPEEEVDLCGHATLATAHVLFTHFHAGPALRFHTLSGVLTVTRCAEGGYTMVFPSRPPAPYPAPGQEGGAAALAALLAALGLDTPASPQASYIGKARDILLHLPSAADVLAVRPNFELLARVPALCVIVAAASSNAALGQVVSRVFCPGCGVPEDPVTGSAHCTIAPYFGQLLGLTQLRCLQASQRGGLLDIALLPPGQEGEQPQVTLTGTCTLYSSGEVAVAFSEEEWVVEGAAGGEAAAAAGAAATLSSATPSQSACSTSAATQQLLHSLDTLVFAPAAAAAAPASTLPVVTLTYAQTLDGALAAARGVHTILSCPASLAVTHALRARHAAILVGAGTVASDNPRLNTRLCPGPSPTVCVLDPLLTSDPASAALSEVQGRPPAIVLHGAPPPQEEQRMAAALQVLKSQGVRCLQLPGSAHSPRHLCLATAFAALAAPPYALGSIMVEGGAGLHASLVTQHRQAVAAGGEKAGLITAVLVTIAPRVMAGGLHIEGSGEGAGLAPLELDFRHVARVGEDMVVLALPKA